MRNSSGTGPVTRKGNLAFGVVLFIGISVSFLGGCSGGSSGRAEFVYVAVPDASLRDRVATIYTKTGLVHNGERLQVLERMQNKRFVRVRTPRGEEGWLQERFLADQQTYDQFARLAEQYRAAPAQGTATIETQVKAHVLPGRKTGYLYLLNEKDKVELLERRTADRNATPGKEEKAKDPDADSSDDEPDKPGQPAILEDWWLIRDPQKRTGWVLGHALYLDVPDDDKKVGEYLTLLTEPKDGMPYDFNQARVFTWNTRKHRYETAYRESKLSGVLPVTMGQQDFGKEGSLPTFTLVLKQDGTTRQQTYRFNRPIVRKVYAAGEEPKSKSHSKKTSTRSATKARKK